MNNTKEKIKEYIKELKTSEKKLQKNLDLIRKMKEQNPQCCDVNDSNSNIVNATLLAIRKVIVDLEQIIEE